MEDVARAVEMRAERLQREVDDMVAAFGLVEVELVAGEEPEAGVEVEVRAVMPTLADWTTFRVPGPGMVEVEVTSDPGDFLYSPFGVQVAGPPTHMIIDDDAIEEPVWWFGGPAYCDTNRRWRNVSRKRGAIVALVARK